MIPILSSFRDTLNPGEPRSTMKAVMPCAPFDLSVLAYTMSRSAIGAFVMNIFVPFMT